MATVSRGLIVPTQTFPILVVMGGGSPQSTTYTVPTGQKLNLCAIGVTPGAGFTGTVEVTLEGQTVPLNLHSFSASGAFLLTLPIDLGPGQIIKFSAAVMPNGANCYLYGSLLANSS